MLDPSHTLLQLLLHLGDFFGNPAHLLPNLLLHLFVELFDSRPRLLLILLDFLGESFEKLVEVFNLFEESGEFAIIFINFFDFVLKFLIRVFDPGKEPHLGVVNLFVQFLDIFDP